MAYNFEVKAIATLYGYVEADSKEEALRKIKDNDYDDVELVDDEMNINSIDKYDIEED